MKIKRYIRGNRKGKEANRLEKEAMKDSFLADALEGYDKVKANHPSHIMQMRRRIILRNRRQLNIITYISIAASLLVVFGFSYYYLIYAPLEEKNRLVASREQLKEEERKVSDVMPAVAPALGALADSSPEESDVQEEKLMAALTESEAELHPVQSSSRIRPLAKQRIAAIQPLTYTVEGARPASGVAAYTQYIQKNYYPPTDEACDSVAGDVILTFEINKNGRPVNIQIRKSLCDSFDQETIRLLKEGDDWEKLSDALAIVTFTYSANEQ